MKESYWPFNNRRFEKEAITNCVNWKFIFSVIFWYNGAFDSPFNKGNSIIWSDLFEMDVPNWEIHEDPKRMWIINIIDGGAPSELY